MMGYQYMLLKFPGFDGQANANLILFSNIVNMIALLILVPLISTRLHDSLILTIGLSLTCLGLILAANAQKLWQIYLSHVSLQWFHSSSCMNSIIN